MESLVFNVNGTMFLSKKIIKMVADDVSSGDYLELKPEPTNKYDPHAVKVLYDDRFIGYVEQDLSEEVSQLIESGVDYNCEVIFCFAEWDSDITDSGREIEFVTSIDLIAEIKY